MTWPFLILVHHNLTPSSHRTEDDLCLSTTLLKPSWRFGLIIEYSSTVIYLRRFPLKAKNMYKRNSSVYACSAFVSVTNTDIMVLVNLFLLKFVIVNKLNLLNILFYMGLSPIKYQIFIVILNSENIAVKIFKLHFKAMYFVLV